ncbi:DNA repair protein RecO C-terminal domain-containing protein [Acinetobacter sp. B51(2017)]|uniref:DNA repair protein RecO n=1 Tax=Acinetobacter sp. B51(2017) TaxID=2060938 RepID=UPI000F075FAF|nr:DNA repair protein RecO C-terminal domain-containing protein [Acinetobacter sp. B51(2017)]
MRNQPLHGYLIHHRKYRERSHIVHLFTQEYGRIDGVLRHTPPPQYQPIALHASGKSELKNFSQIEMMQQPIFFFGDAFFAGFYLNELILRLCPLEEVMPSTFLQYGLTLNALQNLPDQSDTQHYLKQILRQFEHILLEELGYAIDFSVDSNGQALIATQHYIFQLNDGFLATHSVQNSFLGQDLLQLTQYEKGRDFSAQQLQLVSKLYRQILSALLGDRPLKSRQLWIQNTQTQNK